MTPGGNTRDETTPCIDGATPHAAMRAVFVPPAWRFLVGVLVLLSGASLLAILAALVFLDEGPHNPLRLIRLVAGFCLLPGLSILLLRWAFAGVVRVQADTLVLEQRHQTVEIALREIVALEPWLLPLPGSGLWLRLQSGRRWRDGLQIDDPAALVEALADVHPEWAAIAAHPSLVYARAKHAVRPPSRYRALLRFPIFALVPTLPFFRVHQVIAYGGAFGEYYQYGLRAYLLAFAIYWATLTIYLMLYATALRVPIEALAMVGAMAAPARATQIRRLLERVAALLYYGGVPLLVGLRFFPW